MEYVIPGKGHFQEIEAQAMSALEEQGFAVQRTFSLHSVAMSGSGSGGACPGYGVLMLYASGARHEPLGLLILYERGEQTVIHPAFAPSAVGDVEAEVATALVLGGLDFCIDAAGRESCIRPRARAAENAGQMSDSTAGTQFWGEAGLSDRGDDRLKGKTIKTGEGD
jgi:hypothetical protein